MLLDKNGPNCRQLECALVGGMVSSIYLFFLYESWMAIFFVVLSGI